MGFPVDVIKRWHGSLPQSPDVFLYRRDFQDQFEAYKWLEHQNHDLKNPYPNGGRFS